ncbi:MAG: hypothetical protein WKF88_04120 [Ferruginibacter sp.]
MPDMGSNGQEIIDKSIEKSNYDIFIGIMQYRFGTQTKDAGCGTEHEYLNALKRKSNDTLPIIIFFFNNEKIDPTDFDGDQYNLVTTFKNGLQTKGLYVDYDGAENFKEKLEEKLNLFVKEVSSLHSSRENVEKVDSIRKKLELDLKDSLKSFNEDAPVWIEPIISTKRNVDRDASKNYDNKIEISTIVENPKDVVIQAPSEFGLTSLAHYVKLEAWNNGKTFIYIDLKFSKKHKIVTDIQNLIKNDYGKTTNDIDCIIIDSFIYEGDGNMKMVKNVADAFKTIPIILMGTIESQFIIAPESEQENIRLEKDFTRYYLLPLPQSEIRKIVTGFALSNTLEEDNDIILNKVTKDLQVLNIHRTPKNCITVLKASSKIGSDYSAVNRTKLLDTILSIIFEEYEIPTYKSQKPDIKDCTFVLGYFCELLIKKNDYEFNEDFFKKELRTFCEASYIELDLNYLFQVLLDNSIFTQRFGTVYFKSAYWLFYFIAHRMNINKDFLNFIFEKKKYVDYPEIMEFYTGIDRNKEDALRYLLTDIQETLNVVKSKVKIDGNLNPYTAVKWEPVLADFEKEEEKISKNVLSSGLPDEVKDRYDDNYYDQIRPYSQVIHSVMKEYSFLILMRQISACSRALRNSDFVNSEIKKSILNEIIAAWNEVSKILIILSPILADKGNVAFEGAAFELNQGDFEFDSAEEKRFAVLLSIPKNVVDFYKDDLFSIKMGPLIIDKAIHETNSLLKHELMRLIVSERPKKWNTVIDNYIVSLDKNSFFLSDIASALNTQFDYHVTEIEARRILGNLLHKCRAKHIFKTNNPDLGLIKKAREI